MTTLELTEWRPGLNTVALIKAVRTFASRSLSEAKTDVERFLDGEVVVLEFSTDQSREAFRKEAEKLGVGVR
jgi:ribosomal protein L7/L12